MSKAEEKAWEWSVKNKLDPYSMGRAYGEGYKQAEKDLALTIEVIEKIDNLLWDLSSKWSGKSNNKGYFEEVLNRFSKLKGR